MTDTERLILEGIAAILDMLPNARARLIYDKIEAAIDSQMADEVDALK